MILRHSLFTTNLATDFLESTRPRVRAEQLQLDRWRTLVARAFREHDRAEYLDAAREAVNDVFKALVHMDKDDELMRNGALAMVMPIEDEPFTWRR